MCLVLAAASASAARSGALRVTCAAAVARDAAHERWLRAEMTRALADLPVAAGHTIDLSLVRLDAKRASKDLEVRVEMRALLSDDDGRIRVQTTTRATTRGAARDRTLLERDAIGAAADDLQTVLATTVASR